MEVVMAMKRRDGCPDRGVCDVLEAPDLQFWPAAIAWRRYPVALVEVDTARISLPA